MKNPRAGCWAALGTDAIGYLVWTDVVTTYFLYRDPKRACCNTDFLAFLGLLKVYKIGISHELMVKIQTIAF